jgi:hypothetical protein
MIEHLYSIVLAWMIFLSPARSHEPLAWAVASVAASEDEAALLTAIAFRESSLDNSQVGDGGRSVCAMQIHGGSRSLLDDVGACVRRGTLMLRESMRVDPSNPVAFYARGPRYQRDDARRISRDRVALARRLLERLKSKRRRPAYGKSRRSPGVRRA